MPHCNRTIVVFQVSNRDTFTSESMSHRNQHENDKSERHTTISQESLEALVNVGDGISGGTFPSGEGWNPFAYFSGEHQESTPALTDCSSRSSLQDLDLSVDDGYEYFRDPQPSPDLPYIHEDGPNTPRSYLPSVLVRSSPRSVSFSGIETIFGADDEATATDESHSVLRYPTTPSIEWYSSKGSSQRTLQGTLQRRAFPPLVCSPRHNPQLQPRRSALKKQDRAGGSVSSTEASFIQIPSSPKITWYSSKR